MTLHRRVNALTDMDILIIAGNVNLKARLYDTACARAIWEALPIETGFNVWGDEFYFEIPVKMELDETATSDVNIGDIGYWPKGNALALFFGPTPMSSSEKPVPASDVNMAGKILDDATALKRVKRAGIIRIERL